MKLKNFRLWNFLAFLGIAVLYPVYAYVSTEVNPLLPFLNGLTIVGIVFVIMGIVVSLINHGDFDIAEYVTRRAAAKGNIKPFDAFKEDKKEKREGHFNYPLFTGLVMIAASAILSALYY